MPVAAARAEVWLPIPNDTAASGFRIVEGPEQHERTIFDAGLFVGGVDGVHAVRREPGAVVVLLGSGDYRLRLSAVTSLHAF